LLDIRRDDRQLQLGGERCPLTRYRMRKAMINESTHQRNGIVEQSTNGRLFPWQSIPGP
jgi:hypothetical protein